MKILVCGDIHCKPYLFTRALGCTKWDYFVFLGDACDNFGATQEDNLTMIKLLAETKEKYGDKFIWLIGNHDWGYYDDSINMSGHILAGSANIKALLEKYKDMWDIMWTKGRFIFSHAGLSHTWLQMTKNISYRELKDNIGLNNPMNQVGHVCGGDSDTPSCIWARPEEIVPLPPELDNIQIVGHTPVERITPTDNGLVICDTMSQYPNGRHYGDCSLLVIEGNISTGGGKMKAINPETGRKMYDITYGKTDANPTRD